MIWHIYPTNDTYTHFTDGEDCPCKPSAVVLENGDIQMIHNSWDGREYIERLVEPDNICTN